MRAFFQSIASGTVNYIKDAGLTGWDVLVAGAKQVCSLIKQSWTNAKATWNANHGVRAVAGFVLSLLAVPFIAVATVVVAVAAWSVGFVLIPAAFIALAATLVAAIAVILIYNGTVWLIDSLSSAFYTTVESAEPVVTPEPVLA